MNHLPSKSLFLCHGKCERHSSYSPYAFQDPHPNGKANYVDFDSSTDPDFTLDLTKHMTRIKGRYNLIVAKNCPPCVYTTDRSIRSSFWKGIERLLHKGGVFFGVITPKALEICGHPRTKQSVIRLPLSFAYAKLYRDRFAERVLKVCKTLEFFEIPLHFFALPQLQDIAIGLRKIQ